MGFHTISKKALHKQGPVPTDHGQKPPAKRRTSTSGVLVTGPLSLVGQRWERDSTCCLRLSRRRSRR